VILVYRVKYHNNKLIVGLSKIISNQKSYIDYFLLFSKFLITNHNLAIPTHTIAAKNVGPIIYMNDHSNNDSRFIRILSHQLAKKRKINITASIENIGNCHHLDVPQTTIQNIKVTNGINAK
jgi:hypothetical protein